jgi:hypothetical protein
MRRALSLFLFLLAASAFAGENLLQNPSFEIEGSYDANATLNWKLNDPDDHGDSWGAASRENWRSHDGQFAAAIRGTWANAGDYGGWWQELECQPGEVYRLTAWLWADGSWSAKTQDIKIEFWNIDRSTLVSVAMTSVQDASEIWSQKSVESRAPDGSFWVRVVINVSGAGPAGSLMVDDLDLQIVPKKD